MAQGQASVADLFRWAQALKRENPQLSYKEIKQQLVLPQYPLLAMFDQWVKHAMPRE